MKRKLPIILLLLFFLITTSLFSCSNKEKPFTNTNNLKVYYFDVGQGDSILIQVNNKNLLIDGGPKDAESRLIKDLKDFGVKKLDYVITTHPHEDHIGGMGQVIKNFDIGKFYAPKVTSNTKTFEYMVNQLNNKNLKINIIKPDIGSDIDLGKNTKVEIFSPNSSSYDNLNNYSPIIKISYKETSFLFTGDAEKLSEKEVLEKGYAIQSDVLKIGHHGSSSSTSKEFLNKVNPKMAVISVGKNNDYGHPHKETISSLKNKGIKYFRTDEEGTITLESDGKTVTKK
jgi:competence protein ComEC